MPGKEKSNIKMSVIQEFGANNATNTRNPQIFSQFVEVEDYN